MRVGGPNSRDGLSPACILLCWVLAIALFFAVMVCNVEAKTIAFPEMDGWDQPEKPQLYSPETLYEYIDGAADLYLSYEFQELGVAEYRDAQKASVTVEIYRHSTPTQAFGIYSQERLANAKLLDIGAEGYQEPTVLNFVAGPYYVKINGYNTGPEDERTLLVFGRKIEEILGGKTPLPGILTAFPQDGLKPHSEKLISKDFLGYAFLHSGFTADYVLSGKAFKIFVIEGKDRDDCRGMIDRYLRETGTPGESVEGLYRLKDRHHGDVDLLWRGKFIWGTLNLDDPGLRSMYLKEVEGRGF
jgi:hypothetical protein